MLFAFVVDSSASMAAPVAPSRLSKGGPTSDAKSGKSKRVVGSAADSVAASDLASLGGWTLLDCAKAAIEHFITARQRLRREQGLDNAVMTTPEGETVNVDVDRFFLLSAGEQRGNRRARAMRGRSENGAVSPALNIDREYVLCNGWSQTISHFKTVLRQMRPAGTSDMGGAIRASFDLLNLHRCANGIDTFGHGRVPWFIEPAIVLVFTRSGFICSRTPKGIRLDESVVFPQMRPGLQGSSLVTEPFRWDQRVCAVSLQLHDPHVRLGSGGEPEVRDANAQDRVAVLGLTENTSGSCQVAFSLRGLLAAMDKLVATTTRRSVVVRFSVQNYSESTIDPVIECPTLPPSTILSVASPGGSWPIPEPYWLDPATNPSMLPPGHPPLPPRDALPMLVFRPTIIYPQIPEHLPHDRYELEHGVLTNFVLEHRNAANRSLRAGSNTGPPCFPVFIANSSAPRDTIQGVPSGSAPLVSFGFLRASSTEQKAFLFVLPFNYATLMPLLDELRPQFAAAAAAKAGQGAISAGESWPLPGAWKVKFDHYLYTLPRYYIPFLRNGLKRFFVGHASNSLARQHSGRSTWNGIGAPPWTAAAQHFSERVLLELLPEHLDNQITPQHVQHFLKQCKQDAKAEVQLWASAYEPRTEKQQSVEEKRRSESQTSDSKSKSAALAQITARGSSFLDGAVAASAAAIEELDRQAELSLAAAQAQQQQLSSQRQLFNAFDIPREDLIREIVWIRSVMDRRIKQVVHKTKDTLMDQTKHMLPIADMGNYQAVLNQQQTLRNVYDESNAPKEVTFQNPYKFDSRRKGKDMSGFVLGADEFDLDTPDNEPSDEPSRDKESPAAPSPATPTPSAIKSEPAPAESQVTQDEPVVNLKRKSEEPLDESRDTKRARPESTTDEEPEVIKEQQRPAEPENAVGVKGDAEVAPLASGAVNELGATLVEMLDQQSGAREVGDAIVAKLVSAAELGQISDNEHRTLTDHVLTAAKQRRKAAVMLRLKKHMGRWG